MNQVKIYKRKVSSRRKKQKKMLVRKWRLHTTKSGTCIWNIEHERKKEMKGKKKQPKDDWMH